ncbi:hypothetical protein C2S51_033271 [Perilla frutescens var. frutescens]|nr:hypothetical protein C2S51_033271 [Perilla frutescens var. frutescens]
MGGIGKTTLARYAYDDPSNVHHFDVRVWVTISRPYQLRVILLSFVRSIKNLLEEVYKHVGNEKLKENVYRYLKGRRYLIVMDDMWDTDVWDNLQMMLPDDVNGSRIIITTRELSVASYVDSLRRRPHEMRLMAVDQSWSLLKAKVFGREDCPQELQKIGEFIAEKCRGLPLAIVVIAGVLSYKFNQTKHYWEMIARNVSKAVNTSSDEQFYDILSLSYMNLPRHLKPCFLYMGVFPEDYEINASYLIRLWAAEGFLIPKESKDMEELGDEYLEDLANRSLVLICKKRSDGKIKTVKIHDVLRDLCLRKCRDKDFLSTVNDFWGEFPQGIENSKRLSILCDGYGSIPNMESESSHIRTILVFQHWAFDFWKNFRHVKILDVSSVTFRSSDSVRYIGELIHLRYFALTCESSAKILTLVSESLYQLHNLQTLIVRILKFEDDVMPQELSGTSGYIHIEVIENKYQPYMVFEIARMQQLRHLILLDGFLPDLSAETSRVISSLENLQTLWCIKDFKCSERISEMIPNLRKLGIIYSYKSTYETGWSEYGLNNLVHLQRLEKLSLYAEPYPNLKNDLLSQNICFPVTLKKLCLSGCRFRWEDMGMIGSLPNLQVLKLKRRACLGTQWETTEGEFCQLKVLLIDSTDLHNWETESSHFPKLERLTLYECNSLREIPYGIGDIPTLELIEVDIRNLSVLESAKCVEEEQRSCGNELLQIRFLKSRSWPIKTSR